MPRVIPRISYSWWGLTNTYRSIILGGDFGDLMFVSPMFSPIIFLLDMYTSLLITLVPQAEVTSIKDMRTSILLTS